MVFYVLIRERELHFKTFVLEYVLSYNSNESRDDIGFWGLMPFELWICLGSSVVPSSFRWTGTPWRGFHLYSWAKGQNHSNTWGKTTQNHTVSTFPLSPKHRAHVFFLGLQFLDNQLFLFFVYCESLFQAFLDILLYTIFYDSTQIHTKRNVSYEVLTSILLCISIKLAEHVNGISSVDSVTLESFSSTKDCTFSMLP